MKAIVGDGKYEIVFNEETGVLNAYRHGELWRDLVGDGMVLAMLTRICALEMENKALHLGKQAATYAAKREEHWTDAHIMKAETVSGKPDKFFAYNEAGLQHGEFKTHDEARDALVLYSASLNKPSNPQRERIAASLGEADLQEEKFLNILRETGNILGLKLNYDPGFVPVRATVIMGHLKRLKDRVAELESELRL